MAKKGTTKLTNGVLLKRLIDMTPWGARTVASKAGVSPQSVYKMLGGVKPVEVESIEKVATLFGKPKTYLYSSDEIALLLEYEIPEAINGFSFAIELSGVIAAPSQDRQLVNLPSHVMDVIQSLGITAFLSKLNIVLGSPVVKNTKYLPEGSSIEDICHCYILTDQSYLEITKTFCDFLERYRQGEVRESVANTIRPLWSFVVNQAVADF